ncbi:SusD/RagB family nutrient-binding outer membrane lipoprotein [Mucilaginibacter ginsenosidivorax]|uniref:SusD/RagB family nutrient-binding outer membrane lipoprotein n=1 Tax=Mucilaginibacter ginsenosidivorax TaxID=862126 RepID=A0A5B8W2X3_9SPHI|nr:SusD/RagB family nutrient-binding outer membrane lipoprotein [Mucilaginibacter ginsenosidivorax]QEC76668.1 SusD/RagB family nutrient-binding outer membrane lipoprotein [Mucilaginibacter ginsenosidivorax]
MKKILGVFLLTSIVFSACKKDLTSLNNDPKNPSIVPSYALFTNAQRRLTNTVTSSNVNLNIFRLIEQQWQETTYTDESNYDITTRPIPDDIWNALYRDVIYNFERTKALIPTDVTGADIQKNEIAITDVMQVYTYYYLVTTFGDIPYTEALDISKPFPKFDDAKTVYYSLLTRLDADIAALNTGAASFGSADVIYGGDVTKWKKFAATLKLKMGITIADLDNAKAKTVVESAVATGVFTSNSDNAQFQYLTSPPNTNPVWVDLVQSARQDFVACSTIMGFLKPQTAFADPRLPYYFTVNSAGTYTGADPGSSATFSLFSKPSGPLLVSSSIGKITNPDFPGLLLDYSETEFNLAEAISRGYAVAGSVAGHYNSAVTASITYWGASATAAAAYLLQPTVAFATATGGTDLHKIGLQKYLALYNRGWDAWTETRRLDYPVLTAPSTAQTAFPVRLTYPVNEQNVNVTNYNKAATAIGGDLVTTKLFFDKH